MDSKTVKLNCLTLGELQNEPISKKKWSIPLTTYLQYLLMLVNKHFESSQCIIRSTNVNGCRKYISKCKN